MTHSAESHPSEETLTPLPELGTPASDAETPVPEGATPPSDLEASGVAEVSPATEREATTSPRAEVRANSRAVEQAGMIEQDIAHLQRLKSDLEAQVEATRQRLDRVVTDSLGDLEARQEQLRQSIEKLERRRERLREEMRQNFAGASQEVALRVQGFRDYLVGSLQDLAAAAEQLQLVPSATTAVAPDQAVPSSTGPDLGPPVSPPLKPGFVEPTFERDEVSLIEEQLTRYQSEPDYYGAPWTLRRTFEPVHAEKVRDWFFTQGGRGAVPSLGSRLQNILVASAVISVLNFLYGAKLQVLVLANSPERLGDWRRGLQDCLGLAREDFNPNQGIAIFPEVEPLIQKAQRIEEAGDLALIVIDESEDRIATGLLQFPLLLAFARDSSQPSYDYF